MTVFLSLTHPHINHTDPAKTTTLLLVGRNNSTGRLVFQRGFAFYSFKGSVIPIAEHLEVEWKY